MILDNNPDAFGFQLDNGILISSWFGDSEDRELLKVIQILKGMVEAGSKVPEFVRRKFGNKASSVSL